MNPKIRNARSTDVIQISQIIEQAFDEQVSSEHLAQMLQEDDHRTLVAVDDGRVLGFVDAFFTLDCDMKRRWELDLIAVEVSQRGCGIGQLLVKTVTQAGKGSGADYVRSLVAVDNHNMHKTMLACDYTTDDVRCSLHISAAGNAANVQLPTDAYIVPVNTLTYRGLWLECHISPDVIALAHFARKRHQLDLIGAVVSNTAASTLKTLHDAGFARVGDFQWWRYIL